MSVKEKRSVTFEEPTASLLVREPNNNCSSYSFYKADSLPRRRVRSRSWSRLRARWSKVSHERPDLSYEAGVYPQAEFRSLARSRSHSSVRSLVKLFEVLSMSEGRKSQVVLLDDRRLDIIIQPKLFANELLDLVASHFKLKEKQYFGLGFLDETNHFNWLQGEKRVLDHEFPKKAGLLILYFAIKFYIDTIGLLRDIQTVELFYLSARQNISRGHLLCEPEKVFELAAYVLQATNGDFISEEITREELKKLPVIPTGTLKEHPSISYCEDRIIAYYEKINGTSRGLAIVNYMTVVERLSAYGIHYYDVKDKKDIPWCLGVSPKGIAVYDRSDKSTPRKLFHWKSLENLYYKDKKFSIEVHSPRRTSANHRSASNIDVHTWFASTQQLTKCIWSMAVGQHQFYLDSKHNQMLPAARSMSEIATDLCRSTSSLAGSLGSDLSRSTSSHSLPSLSNSRYDLTVEQADSMKAERDMYRALRARKEALEECLREKTAQLKLLCLQEGELTGELPRDTPLSPGEQPPVFRRRVGTAFSLSVKNIQDTDQLSSELSKLELEVELQAKITAAAHKLANDKSVSKYVRKQRRQSYTKAIGKLKDMEKKLDDMRKAARKTSSLDHHPGGSFDGMYYVQHLHSRRELDTDRASVVHDRSCCRYDDSCGNSINSGDFSMGSKDASSGYYSASSSSIYSSPQQGIADDLSSYCGSESPSTIKSFRDDMAGDLINSDGGDFMLGLEEHQSSTLTHPGRRKHFIISRGPQNARVRELGDDLNVSKSSTSTKCDEKENSHLATSESALDLDCMVEDSFSDNCFFDGCEDDLRDEEVKSNTRVERRGLTFIASRGLLKNFHLDVKPADFERGWKTFQQILMGEDGVSKHNVVHKEQVNSASNGSEGYTLEQNGAQKSRESSDEELQQRIRELIDSEETAMPLVRTRSFDYARDMRVNSRKNFNISRSKDDMKLTSPRSKSKNSTTHLKNPFVFFSQKLSKPKQTRHSSSGSQPSAVYACLAALPSRSAVQTCVHRSHPGSPTKITSPNSGSKLAGVSDPHCGVSTKSVSSLRPSKDRTASYRHHPQSPSAASYRHHPQSLSGASVLSSCRGSDSREVLVNKLDDAKAGHDHYSIARIESGGNKRNASVYMEQQHRRRSSWHSNSSQSISVLTKATETTV